MLLQEDSLVEIYQDKKIVCAYSYSTHNNSLMFVTEDGKDIKLHPSKVLFVQKYPALLGLSREEIRQELKKISARREEISRNIPEAEIWEFALESNEDKKSYTSHELAELYYGQSASPDEERAMFRLLVSDKLYFDRKDELFFVNGREHVENLLEKRSLEEKRKLRREAQAASLADLMSGKIEVTPLIEELIPLLIEAAVYKNDSPKEKEIGQLLSLAGLSSPHAAFDILVKLGIFSPDENLLLRMYNIEKDFPEELLCECRSVISRADFEKHIDYTHLKVMTIDDESTKDIDDGLSVERIGENYRVGVHIAEVTHYVLADSILDSAARSRATSIYLPDQTINMLPRALCEKGIGLDCGEKRLALSFFFTLTPDAVAMDFAIEKTVIKVAERLTYEHNPEIDRVGSDLNILYNLAQRLLEKRIAGGALYTPFPRASVKVVNSIPIIKIDDPSEPMQLIVSEFMVLANSHLASYCFENDIPAIYRNQPKPKDSLPENLSPCDPVAMYHLRRYLQKVTLSVDSTGHFGLGAEHYIQGTSPLRRYTDLIMHRQIKHFTETGGFLYSREELLSIIAATDELTEQASFLEKKSKHYWLLKYIESLGRQEIRALVLRASSKSMNVQLCGILLEAEVEKPSSRVIQPGSYVYVVPEVVWPRDGELRLTFTGIEEN